MITPKFVNRGAVLIPVLDHHPPDGLNLLDLEQAAQVTGQSPLFVHQQFKAFLRIVMRLSFEREQWPEGTVMRLASPDRTENSDDCGVIETANRRHRRAGHRQSRPAGMAHL